MSPPPHADESPLPHYLREVVATAVARLRLDSTVVEANAGFWAAVGRDVPAPADWPSAHLFRQPTFAHLTELRAKTDGPLLFRGAINLGEPGALPASLRGSVYRSGDGLLLVAERDVAEWERLRSTVLGLNDELAETQRQLVRDIQARRRAERELEETNRGIMALYAELEDKAQAVQRISDLKTRFFSYMSHEFRTPLNAILSLSGFLLDRADGELTAEQEKQAAFIRQSAASLLEMVNDLLDLARIEAGKTTVRPETFEVGELFAALRGMLRPLLTSDRVSLIFEEPAGLPPLHTDRGKVAQVLRNFISNALKFTESGEVRVTAARADPGSMVFSVSDTGIGIAPADQQRIFEEFAQVEGPLQRQFKGTGLGLPLSRQLAVLLGGDVSVASAPGAGSTFSIRLPLVYRGELEAEAPPPPPRPEPGLAPVLVVEDDAETVALYRRYLHSSGFQVLAARTLAEARAVLAEVRPAAVVLDVVLEQETCLPLLLELKRNPATRAVPVLVVTVIGERETALALGADDFCLKPVERAWLLDRLRALAQQGPAAKVLIVDDDAVSRYLLRGLLGETRYAVLEAENGGEGLRLARQERPQLIFLDLVMPDLTGFEVLERLKSDAETRDIPVVINSGRELDEAERRYLAARTVAVVAKDVPSREEAVRRIREALVKAGLTPG